SSSSITTAATDRTRSTAGRIPEVSTSTTTHPSVPMLRMVPDHTDIDGTRDRSMLLSVQFTAEESCGDTDPTRRRRVCATHRRRRRAALAGRAVVFAVVLGGVAISVSGPPRVSTAARTGGSGQEAGPDLDVDADAVTRPPTPDGHVHLDEAGGPHRLPAGWADVPAVLTGAVDAAGDDGLDLSLCVRAIDSPTAPMRCAGGVERAYAASVTKLAYAVGALEAWEGDAEAETPLGATVGDLVDQAISVSDNEAADLLALLSASGPGALDADPFTAINTVTARVG